MKLRRIIRRRCELLENPSTNTRRWLLHSNHWTIAEITLNEENHFIITHQYFISADIVQPPLQRSLHPRLVLVCASSSCCDRWGNRWDKCLRVRRYQMICQFDKLGVRAANIAELCCSEFGKVGLQL
jgi:hypothetical protein